MALLPPFFINCVVAIGAEVKQTGKIRWFGTGFFYGAFVKKVDETQKLYNIYLATNKHVLEEEKKIFFRINPQDEQAATDYQLDLKDSSGKNLWEGHRLKSVDVAVIPVNYELFKHMAVAYFHSDDHTVGVNGMKAEGTSEGDAVFLLGFPMGLVGEKRSSVIVRSGVLARVADTLRNPLSPFLVDVLAFPGNSGGPVVTRPELNSITGTQSPNKASLIGMVASYVPYRDISYSIQTRQPTITISQNSGLAHVFSVDCIRQAIAKYERRAKTAKKDADPKKSEKLSEELEGVDLGALRPGM